MDDNSIKINMAYLYKGSCNSSLKLLERVNGDVDLITDYGEIITSIQTGYGLMRVLEDLYTDKYA